MNQNGRTTKTKLGKKKKKNQNSRTTKIELGKKNRNKTVQETEVEMKIEETYHRRCRSKKLTSYHQTNASASLCCRPPEKRRMPPKKGERTDASVASVSQTTRLQLEMAERGGDSGGGE